MNDGWSYASACGQKRLKEFSDRALLRHLHPERFVDEKARADGIIDLTTNDYLGFRHNKEIQNALRASIGDLPASAGASRLLGGEHPIFAEAEAAFSTFKGAESSLFFSSGFAANEALCSLLTMPDAAIFSDALNHASIIDGLRLIKAGERLHIYPHNDLGALEAFLVASQARVNFVYTESLFSMDGDLANIAQLLALCAQYRGVLILDEAHAVGAYGERGQGLLAASGFTHDRVITMSTCGKAIGVQGAFVSGPAWVRDLLINQARSFIYSTGSSPWIAAAVKTALTFVAEASAAREHLSTLSHQLRAALQLYAYDLGPSNSFIIPVLLNDEVTTLKAQAMLRERGVYVAAIRPPTVPIGSARLRLSLTADLNELEAERVIDAFAQLKQGGVLA